MRQSLGQAITLALGIMLLPLVLAACQGAQLHVDLDLPEDVRAPIADVANTTHVAEWLVLGPFPNPAAEGEPKDGITRLGFNTDYLTPIGGEKDAVLTQGLVVNYEGEDGSVQTATARRAAAAYQGLVNFETLYGAVDGKVAYAFAYLASPRQQKVVCFFGSDDSAKVWVNGKRVHRVWTADGRSVEPRGDRFQALLRKGANTVLVKVEEGQGDWGFVLEVLSGEAADEILAEEDRIAAIREFQSMEIKPAGRRWGSYLFSPRGFPRVDWEYPHLVGALWGDIPLETRWFDADLNEVEKPTGPGRYAAYSQGETKDGRIVRRAFTGYCLENVWGIRRGEMDLQVPYFLDGVVSEEAWNAHQDGMDQFARDAFLTQLFREKEGAVELAGLAEWTADHDGPAQLAEARTLDQDFHLALKRKILGVDEDTYPALRPPRKRAGGPAPVLREGTLEEAGMKEGFPDRIREVCQEWIATDTKPFVALVARNGVIVFHEAFGEENDEPIDLGRRFSLASSTKPFCGLLLGQFLDQGLIHEEDMVGKFLPDLPTEGDHALTIRHCMSHTSGLEGHFNWGGMFNPWLDNIVANGAETLKPGRVVIYNGLGLDLTGKVMEIVSGKSIFRLMHDQFLTPLGFDAETTIMDLGAGATCRAIDLGKVAQVMLNRGSYGDTEFMSPETFERLLPRALHEVNPDLPEEASLGGGRHYGMGISPMPRWDKDKNELQSMNTIGHGSATSCVLRADMDSQVAMAIGRVGYGAKYEEFLTRFIAVVHESLVE